MAAAALIAGLTNVVAIRPDGLGTLYTGLGADKGVLIDGNEHEMIMELTDGKGAEAVIDFVGEHGSTTMGLNMTGNGGYYYIADPTTPDGQMDVTGQSIGIVRNIIPSEVTDASTIV